MPSAPDSTVEDMRSFGAPESEIQRWQAEQAKETGDAPHTGTIVLPPDCKQAVEIFLAVDTQWNRLLVGQRLIATGLSYPGVDAALRFLRIKRTPEVFADLKLMEDAALVAMARA